jgi:hypothetical protein
MVLEAKKLSRQVNDTFLEVQKSNREILDPQYL